ncbi:hypothetical protein [Telmatospirillum sp.]|uniref:hypothetical protein n=1 Tax=Telmatospirillum sp. TaxID=2079197 RepID=UPI002840B547|nr:hypothetical protein [Telmatospirillum sp.]MDR3440060.1 hypothetical protein [Telmatospirillum sp.]
MILTPVAFRDLTDLLSRFADALADQPWARAVFQRIAATLDKVAGQDLALSVDPLHHRQAVDLCHRFGMRTVAQPPRQSYTWDGEAVRVDCEPSVVIHEVAHLQCASPSRRKVLDFGLGAGPETGYRDEADQAAGIFGVERDQEEALASLLGVLWEVELGQPAILAFLEQNWLEGGAKPLNRHHFLKNLAILRQNGLIDADGHPTSQLRVIEDAEQFYRL